MKTSLLFILLLTFSQSSFAQSADPERGQAVFQEFCTRCHIPLEIQLRLNNDWLGYPASDLLERISATMPGESEGTLTPQQYLDVTAFVLNIGGIEIGANLPQQDFSSLTIVPVQTDIAESPEVAWAAFNSDLSPNRH